MFITFELKFSFLICSYLLHFLVIESISRLAIFSLDLVLKMEHRRFREKCFFISVDFDWSLDFNEEELVVSLMVLSNCFNFNYDLLSYSHPTETNEPKLYEDFYMDLFFHFSLFHSHWTSKTPHLFLLLVFFHQNCN